VDNPIVKQTVKLMEEEVVRTMSGQSPEKVVTTLNKVMRKARQERLKGEEAYMLSKERKAKAEHAKMARDKAHHKHGRHGGIPLDAALVASREAQREHQLAQKRKKQMDAQKGLQAAADAKVRSTQTSQEHSAEQKKSERAPPSKHSGMRQKSQEQSEQKKTEKAPTSRYSTMLRESRENSHDQKATARNAEQHVEKT